MRRAKPARVFCCNQEYTHSRPWIQRGVLIAHFNHFSWQKNYEGKTPRDSTARYSWIQAGTRPNLLGRGAAAASAGAIRRRDSSDPRARFQGELSPEPTAVGRAGPGRQGHIPARRRPCPAPQACREPPCATPCLSTAAESPMGRETR